MKINLLLYGIVASLLWTNIQSVLLTSTLITGLMGGYLIGRMPLTTFLGALTNNASLPTLPPVSSLLPSFPTFTPRQGEPKQSTGNILTTPTPTTTQAPVLPTYSYTYPPYLPYNYHNYLYPTPAPTTAAPNFNYALPNFYSGNGILPYLNLLTSTTTPSPQPYLDLDPNFFSPVDVPVSLDNKIRERFIRQLALIDPLNCLPKTFCEVTSDPYRAVMALDKGSIVGMASMNQPRITKEELIAYESRLPTPRPPLPPSTPPKPSSTPSPPQREEAEEDEDDKRHSASNEDETEDDVDSGSHSDENDNDNSDEEDDSFERYRKEHEHKIEMQALDEMIDEIEDPETYMYILRDKQKRKEAREKYRQKHNNKKSAEGGFPERRGGAFRQDEEMDMEGRFNDYEEPQMHLTRRTGSDPEEYEYHPPPVLPPPLPQPPPRLPQPYFRRPTTEPSIQDMFADDPFFNDMKGRSARNLKTKGTRRGKGRTKRDLVGDPLTQYRLAYIVAEKYKNPNLCNTAFPSCPYHTKTIMSVVNRLESGLLPFGKSQINRYKEKNPNNLEQFRNTLVAIERLNKATMDARARGEPIDVEEMTEVASNPTAEIDSKASENIINEFQRVVAKIQNAQFTKRRLQLEKSKPKNGDKPRTNYDAVHYHKKAQMDDLKPKERLKTGILQTKSNVRQQDDEAGNNGEVPSFKETYREMFKKGVKKQASKISSRRENEVKQTTQKPTTSKPQIHVRSRTRTYKKPKLKSQGAKKSENKRPADIWEDDERDAKNEELAVDAMISQGKSHHRSPMF